MRRALLLAFALPMLACIAPITPMERLQQSAHDVAAALRFARTDVAADHVAPSARDAFFSRHAVWDRKTRVVDLELVGIYLRTSDEAEAILTVAWLREDGAMLHTTDISQRWKHEAGSFRMVDEEYKSGDKALFEMLPKKEPAKPAPAAKPAPPAKDTAERAAPKSAL
ncbi:MAG: hypothetical protein R3B70_03835 [Polyangiaceae bacterium]